MKYRSLVALLVVAWLTPTLASAYLISYSGSLSSLSGGLQGTGFWPDDGPRGGTTISWVVSQNDDGSWHYVYNLTVPRADVSHFILETSEDFTSADIINPTGPYASYSIGWNTGFPGVNTQPNPYMPDDEYGIKFDSTYGTTLVFTFDSPRMPVWADFYAKCGAVGGTQNTIWNTGFSTSEENDPTAPIGNGSIAYHILAPDTQTGPVPEPGTVCLVGLGLAGLKFIRRRKAS